MQQSENQLTRLKEMCTCNGGYFDNGNYGNSDVNNDIT